MPELHDDHGALTDDALRSAVDAAPDGIVVVDEAGTIVFVNPMVETLFGYRREELVGMLVDQLVPTAARGAHASYRKQYVAQPRARAMGSGLDLHGRRNDGEEFPVEISLSPVRSGDRVLVIAIVRDVTDRRKVETELEQARVGLMLGDERERIARDLHDTVIQRLFAIGLSLQAALARAEPGPAGERISQAIDDIDHAIRDLRSAIFALHTRRPGGATVRDDALAITHEATRALGFEPAVTFSGPIDSATTDAVKEHLLATLRESLSNVAKHARATHAFVEVSVDAGDIVLCVDDDGVGIGDRAGTGNGLPNIRARAQALGGSCLAGAREPRGTRVEWRVPIPRDGH